MMIRKLFVAAAVLAAASTGLATSADAAHYQRHGAHGPGWYGGPGRHHGWYRHHGQWRQHCAWRGHGRHRVWRCW